MRTVDEALADPLPDGCEPYQVTGLIVIAEFLDGDGELLLGWQRTVVSWRALGMLEAYASECRAMLETPG